MDNNIDKNEPLGTQEEEVNDTADTDLPTEDVLKNFAETRINKPCIIHGRSICRKCRAFLFRDGDWPPWSRRGEVQYEWECSSSGRDRKEDTVKCRIHLTKDCFKCSGFRLMNNRWPSWLERDLVEPDSIGCPLEQKNMSAEPSHEAVEETNTCRIHQRNHCPKCIFFKKKNKRWPSWWERDLVEGGQSDPSEQSKSTTKSIEVPKCSQVVPMDNSGIPKNSPDAPRDNSDVPKVDVKVPERDEEVPKRDEKESNTDSKKRENINVPTKYVEASAKNIKFPKAKSGKRKFKPPQVERGEQTYADEDIRKIVSRARTGKNCSIHRLFPCMKCVPWFLEHRQWPTLENRNEINEQWKKRGIKHKLTCSAHITVFCRRCYTVDELFEIFGEKGMKERFLHLVKKVRSST